MANGTPALGDSVGFAAKKFNRSDERKMSTARSSPGPPQSLQLPDQVAGLSDVEVVRPVASELALQRLYELIAGHTPILADREDRLDLRR